MIVSDERGYTFIEMLLVLSIVSIMSFIVFSFTFSKLQPDPFEQTIRQFEFDLREMQTYAMENYERITCWISDSNEFQSFRYTTTEGLLIRRKLPKDMTINIYTLNQRIIFNVNGTVAHIGKVEFLYKDRKVQYSINLGQGRMRLLGK